MARRPITMDEMDLFEVDDSDGRLFWRGKTVVVENRVSLRPLELGLAFVGALGALLSGLHPFGVTLGLW